LFSSQIFGGIYSMSNLRLNLSASTYSVGVYFFGQMALTPLLLWLWGKDTYAHWLVLFTIPAYFGFSDGGIANSFGNALSIAMERRQLDEAGKMVRAVWLWQFVLWASIFAAFLLVLIFLPVRKWLALSEVPFATFAFTAILLAIYSLGMLQGGFYTAVFRAGGSFARYVRLSGHVRIGEVLVLAAAVGLGGGLVAAAFSLVLVRLGFTLWCHSQLGRLLNGVDVRHGPAPWREFAALLPDGLTFLGFPVGNALINQGATILIIHLGGPAAVVTLNVGRQVARIFLQGVSILFQSIHPEISVAFARHDFSRMALLQAKALTPILWGAPVFCLGLAVAGPWAIDLWTHHQVVLGRGAVAAFGIEACMAGLGNAAMLVGWATSRHFGLCVSYLVTQSFALIASWILFKKCGIVGMPLAFAGATLLHAAYSLWSGARIARISSWTVLRDGCLGLPYRTAFLAAI
jgi:O-antigen/teichoic acid export membrane protein